MQTSPRNACETQLFNQAMSEIRLALKDHPMWTDMVRRYNGNIPKWMESALRQHALFYAVEACQSR